MGAKVLAGSGLAGLQRWGAAMAEGLASIPAECWEATAEGLAKIPAEGWSVMAEGLAKNPAEGWSAMAEGLAYGPDAESVL